MNTPDIDRQVQAFLEQMNIWKVIAICGGYLNQNGHETRALMAIEDSIRVLSKYPVAILTGGTTWGVAKIASEQAHRWGLPVIGVLPEIGEDQKLPELDLEIVVPPLFGESIWGDETSVLTKIQDGMIVLGGGPGTELEVVQTRIINRSRIKKGMKPIMIAPIGGFGGYLCDLYAEDHSNSADLPARHFNTGTEAAEYLVSAIR